MSENKLVEQIIEECVKSSLTSKSKYKGWSSFSEFIDGRYEERLERSFKSEDDVYYEFINLSIERNRDDFKEFMIKLNKDMWEIYNEEVDHRSNKAVEYFDKLIDRHTIESTPGLEREERWAKDFKYIMAAIDKSGNK
jgi:hypothetical protein